MHQSSASASPAAATSRQRSTGRSEMEFCHPRTGFSPRSCIASDRPHFHSDSILNPVEGVGTSCVKVTGASFIDLEPDVIEFCIKISTGKPQLSDCRNSIKKREDYIIAIFKKVGIKQREFQEMVHRNNPALSSCSEDKQDELQESQNDLSEHLHEEPERKTESLGFVVDKEIRATCNRITKYLHVVSVCNEKLDCRVQVSDPIISFSSSSMNRATKTLVDTAVANGKAKALNLIRDKRSIYKTVLGPMVYTVEDYFTVDNQSSSNTRFSPGISEFNLLKWRKFHQRLSTQITSVYQIFFRVEKHGKIVV